MTKELSNKSDGITLEKFMNLRDGPLNDPAMKAILEHYAVEDDFEVGDALIFDKDVIHRSVMLDDGEINSRAAFVMRFICCNSLYDAKRANDLEIPRKYFDYSGPTRFHLEVGHVDGEPLISSELFSNDLENRIVA